MSQDQAPGVIETQVLRKRLTTSENRPAIKRRKSLHYRPFFSLVRSGSEDFRMSSRRLLAALMGPDRLRKLWGSAAPAPAQSLSATAGPQQMIAQRRAGDYPSHIRPLSFHVSGHVPTAPCPDRPPCRLTTCGPATDGIGAQRSPAAFRPLRRRVILGCPARPAVALYRLSTRPLDTNGYVEPA